MRLEGKVAVIHGGGGPLARAVEKKFLAEGAKMVIGWYSQKEWEEAKGLIADYNGQFIDMHVDPTKEEQAQQLMKRAKDAFGTIDILLNITGLFFIGPMLWQTDVDIWDKLMDVNLKSAFLCTKHAIPIMLEKGRGRIVFFPSSTVQKPLPGFAAEAVSRSGLFTLTCALREELKDTNITINSINISIMDTWRTRKMPHVDPDKCVKPVDVAELLCCLCSDECDALSGSTLNVFGRL